MTQKENKIVLEKIQALKQEIKEEYELLKKFYGLSSHCWDMLHTHYSHYAFCPANRKSFISEYLAWEDFVERAKKYDVAYYCGIDDFLKEYKNAVYSCLTNLD